MSTYYGKALNTDPKAKIPNAKTDDELFAPAAEDAAGEIWAHQTVIGEKEIKLAAETLEKYKSGKGFLESRVVDDELWWELRHWEAIRKSKEPTGPEPTSAWLFNAILNKHADAMDNIPLPVVLPRERDDEKAAKTLQAILPVLMEQNDFEDVYSRNWWEKLKHGTAVYGVFWNNEKENGLGDVEVRDIDLLKIFWEPGIRDVQKSANLFIVDLVDRSALDRLYPEHKGEFKGQGISVAEYVHDDTVDTSDKAVVVDWYYKIRKNNRTVLHYCKFCNNVVLYATENDPESREAGMYDHGLYPVVFDTLFPEKDTPVGFGYVAICKDPQMYIDKLSQNIMLHSMMGTRPRFFVSEAAEVNEEDFADWNKPFVHTSGEVTETRLREITISPLSPIYQNILDSKITEMKETAANRDVSSGGAGAGVTSGAAISALQEAGNKVSRDMIAQSYRAYAKIELFVIELIRQFYDVARSFRITGNQAGEYDYMEMSNAGLRDQQTGIAMDGSQLFRRPVFDLKIKAMKKSPFSRMEENERAKELYAIGFFNPEKAQESSMALEMMDFEGIDKVKEEVRNGQTLLNLVRQQSEQLEKLAGMVNALLAPKGAEQAAGMEAELPDENREAQESPGGKPEEAQRTQMRKTTDGILDTRGPQTSYGQQLAKKSQTDMDAGDRSPIKPK